jgi:hypothetical protein
MASSKNGLSDFDLAAQRVVGLGNSLLDENEEADVRDIASGLLAGAVQFWLFAHHPCGDPFCESCADMATAEKRLQKLIEESKQFAEESEYYHSPRDSNVGTA